MNMPGSMPGRGAAARHRRGHHPGRETREVADDLWFPNGMAVTPDGSTLIVAESHAHG